jgi:putative methyltransferase (TIGR04325 family)
MNIVRCLQQLFSKKPAGTRFTGDFKSWDEAKRCSSGYDAPEILEKTRAALLKVRAGKAAFERDSRAFDKMEPDLPLLAGLMRAATQDDGRLSVLDFGGSLGGTYFHCRNCLPGLQQVRWSVVEQPAHVACGTTDFANDELRFYKAIDDCLREQSPNVLLLSGVIQYLPEPYRFLRDVVEKRIAFVLVERTAFSKTGHDRLTIQHVPASLYNASYPMWIFSEPAFRRVFASDYDLICEHPSAHEAELEDEQILFKGFHFERKTVHPRQLTPEA